MKNLVLVSAGKKSLHHLYSDGDYDVVLLAYEDFKDDTRAKFYRRNGNKFTNALHYISLDILKKYDNFLLIDDDVLTNSKDIEKIFEIASKNELGIYAPAINPLNYGIESMYKIEGCEIHKQTCSEIMCIGFAKGALTLLLSTFDVNGSGYGLPDLWNWLLKEHFGNDFYNVIDAVEIIHTKPQYQGELYKITNPMQDYQKLISVTGTKPIECQKTKVKYDKNILSVISIYRKEDLVYMKEFLSCLPKWTDNIIFETIKESLSEEKELYKPIILEKKGNVTRGFMTVPELEEDFDFSKAQNALLELCETEWIFKLDVDERFLSHQLKDLQEWLRNSKNHEGIGGYYVTQDSIMYNTISEYGVNIRSGVPTCRLFKNHKEIRYWSAIHETVDRNIIKLGLKINDSTIHLHHLGYERNLDEMIEKANRNLKILWKNPELMNEPEKYQYMLNTSVFIKQLEEKRNEQNQKSPNTRG
jgi:hypothetical protein